MGSKVIRLGSRAPGPLEQALRQIRRVSGPGRQHDDEVVLGPRARKAPSGQGVRDPSRHRADDIVPGSKDHAWLTV